MLLLLACLTTGVVQAKENIVWQAGYDYVAIVPVDAKESSNNSHPYEISPKGVYSLLSSIRLAEADEGFINIDIFSMFSDKEDSESSEFDDVQAVEGDLEQLSDALFNVSELRKISKAISQALAIAKPNEDIVFSVSGRHASFLGKSQLSTTARLFYKSGRLHLIFGEVYVDIRKRYVRSGGTSDVPDRVQLKDLKGFRLKVGTRDKKSKLPVEFVTSDSHFLHLYKGKKRKDWLQIDVARLMEEQEKHKKAETRKNDTVKETDELQQQTREINKEQEQLKDKVERLERLMEAKEKAQLKTEPAKPVAPAASAKSLEQRLTELKQLYDKGVITEDIYKEKVKQMLGEL